MYNAKIYFPYNISHKNVVLKIGDFYETKVNKNGYNFMIYI